MLPYIITGIVVALIVGTGAFFGGMAYRKNKAEATIGSAKQEATRIINQALTTAEQKKKEAVLEAKDEIHKQRSETERDLRERRSEVQRQERRLIQKEENLDKKTDALEKKEIGDVVTAGQKLVPVEAMTMEHTATAAVDGTVEHIHVEVGQYVEAHTVLVTLSAVDPS